MKRVKAYLVGIDINSYRPGDPAEIIGVELVTPEKGSSRVCYHILWDDKTEDWVPIEDIRSYKIIGFQDILAGDIPDVT